MFIGLDEEASESMSVSVQSRSSSKAFSKNQQITQNFVFFVSFLQSCVPIKGLNVPDKEQ